MAIYTGIISSGGRNYLYLSSKSIDSDGFDDNHAIIHCSHPTDNSTAQGDLNRLCNILNNAGSNVVRAIAINNHEH